MTPNMNPILNSSGRLPCQPQASSPNIAPSNGSRAKQQEPLSLLRTSDDQPGAASKPSPVNITDRSARIPVRPATYDYVLPFDGETYKVTTEQITHDDGSCGLNLLEENGDRWLKCSKPFMNAARFERKYNDPDFDEAQHIEKLMLIKDYTENQGCLDFLTRNNIVKVVGNVKTEYVNFPIVELIENRKSSEESSAAASVDSLLARLDAFSEANLVPTTPAFLRYLAMGMKTKERLTGSHKKILNTYINDRDLKVLKSSSFKHIAMFMDYADQTPGLPIACYDFGFTLEELGQLRQQKKSSVDVAFDLLLRK